MDGGRPTTLTEMADKFVAHARPLDRTITKASVYADQARDGERVRRLCCFTFERPAANREGEPSGLPRITFSRLRVRFALAILRAGTSIFDVEERRWGLDGAPH